MPVRIYSNIVEIDIETGVVLWRDEVPWDGVWEEAKKGREESKAATDAALANSKIDSANRAEQYGKENTAVNNLTAIGANGLGLGASGYLANQLNSIGQTYGNARQAVARNNAQRGFAATPDATFASGINSANMTQAHDENEAYNNAQMLTRENTLAGINAEQGLQNTYNPNQSLGTALNGANVMNQQGSVWSDIGKGLGTVAGLATTVAGLPNAFAKGGWTS